MKAQKLFSNCINVNGYSRNAIYDLQNSKVHFVPKDLINYINGQFNYSKLTLDYIEAFEEYDFFLHENNLINKYYTNSFEFPDLNLEYNSNCLIQNLIYVENQFHIDFIEICDAIQNQSLVLIINRNITQDDIYELVEKIEGSKRLCQVRIVLNKHNFKSPDQLVINSSKISDIVLMGMATNTIEKRNKINIVCRVKLEVTEFQVLNSLENMRVDIQLFKESISRNTYYNQLLFIGENGEIKNSPENTKIFGFISDLNKASDILNIIEEPEFKELWFVTKLEIDICKECEYKNMCIDNRLIYKRSSNEYYNKIECNYNPYITKWSHEKGYKTLEECGVISNEHEFSIDHEKIAEINKELWGEDE